MAALSNAFATPPTRPTLTHAPLQPLSPFLARNAYPRFNIHPASRRSVPLTYVYDPYQKIEFSSFDDDEIGFDAIPSPPPTKDRLEILVDNDIIKRLDLSPAHEILRGYVHPKGDNTSEPTKDPKELLQRTVGFVIKYEREDPRDMRELSEIPDVRLWFVRLDGAYPWLPVVLDWRAGELVRYAAMLVPHEMSKKTGLVFNPEALELFAMSKLFTTYSWLKARDMAKADVRVNDMLRILGFKVGEELFEYLKTS